MLVLLAEDDLLLCAVLAETLDDMGHAVMTANNGALAWQIIRAEVGPPDLLLTDIRMPIMDGGKLVQLVGAAYPDLPVITMTGYAPDWKHDAIANSGARLIGSLQKPFDLNALGAMIKSIG
jgi:DNA-binding NtrC family response regulator